MSRRERGTRNRRDCPVERGAGVTDSPSVMGTLGMAQRCWIAGRRQANRPALEDKDRSGDQRPRTVENVVSCQSSHLSLHSAPESPEPVCSLSLREGDSRSGGGSCDFDGEFLGTDCCCSFSTGRGYRYPIHHPIRRDALIAQSGRWHTKATQSDRVSTAYLEPSGHRLVFIRSNALLN